ncbi:uncharacterized protein LOC123536657 [Mercenaria mercenaria]|uniref:uncharacterized protein LOC123536657 n=1 Tax=Mercenaria mercenaria TaxID=6596 RepID=UPI00234F8790|nr:uncharacterized protein LOC123536657 [Mercenaria mercenaria]
MDRLTLNRRQKTTGDKVDCIPAGDGLPVWSILSLDAKLPMMSIPKGSVLLYTTKLGEPKHQCKQEHDFDLRDPNGKYISNEYQPLHDPHLKTHFKTNMMRRHLIKKGFISDDGKVLCSLKEFNQYRQYLRHIYFLEIAKERKEELDRILKQQARDKADIQKKVSRGTVVRRQLHQQRERDTTKLKQYMERKSASIENRLKMIREEMAQKDRKQREEAERRQLAVMNNQQDFEQRKLVMLRKMHQRDMAKRKLIEDRETQKKIRAELKCMETWNTRRAAQKEMLEHYEVVMKQDDEDRSKNISKREEMISKKWERIDNKLEHLKQASKVKKQKKDEAYFKRLSEKLASGDYRIWSRRKERRRSPKKTFHSSWKLQDVLKAFEVPDYATKRNDPAFMAMLNAAIDGAVDMVTSPEKLEERHLKEQARSIVNNVIERVKTDIYPHYLQMLDNEGENEALKSKSVRFSSDEEEIRAASSDSLTNESVRLKPVSEHILTPCASQLELTKLEAEAILGSPEIADNISSVSFVETLLLRLLDDLSSGRLSKDDIMKLASYSMDIIQSAEAEKSDVIMEEPEESEGEGPYLASSSSSTIARKMVDFTLGKILKDIKNGNVHHDDLASLTMSFLDNVVSSESSESVSISETELEAYIEETIKRATSSAMDPREDSPVCEALLDDFMVMTLKSLIKDLEEEVLTKEQVQLLAMSVKEEARQILSSDSNVYVENRDGVQKVLQDVLRELQSGAVDCKTIYQTVFAISYSYNTIKTQLSASAKKNTELIKDILFVVEQNAGNFEDVNLNIVHEANHRLSNADLDSRQTEYLSASIVNLVAKSKSLCNTEISKDVVEDFLLKTKEKLENKAMDAEVKQSVMDVAETVINTIQEIRESPTYADVFLEVLKHLQSFVENMGGIDDMSGEAIGHLITQIESNTISDDNVFAMATTIARVIKSPIQSDSSFAASLAVKDCLKIALNDIKNGSVEDDFLHDIVSALKSVCKASESTALKTAPFLSSLAMFLRNVLNHLTYRMQIGDLNEADVAELSDMFKNKIKGGQTRSEKAETVDTNDPTQMLNFIQNFVNATEKGDLEATDAEEVGCKLIEFGRRLVGSFAERSDKVCSPCTDIVAEDVVEEVIRTLQIEIDNGALSKESLKEMTKVIIESTSASDLASEVVAHTLKGINRDIERGYMPSQLHSIQTIQGSPSASTVASQIVKQTIESITRDISQKGIPQELLSSVAASLVTALSGDKLVGDNLPQELKRFGSTIAEIIDCLRRDEVNQAYAEEIFCLILEQYKIYVLCPKEEGKKQKTDQLLGDDVKLVSNLVMETIRNVERSVAKGRMDNKAFSIPSMPHSEDSSVMAENLIDACLDNIRKDVAAERTMPVQPTHDLVEFVLEIVTRLQSELADGTISNLSMAHFFQAISSEQIDMKTLEKNAAANLHKVVGDIRRYRGNSEYVHRILDTYLAPDKSTDEVFGDPLKAIEAILVNVSSEILTKFVKATLQTILMGMRDDSNYFHEKAPSAYVLRSASSIIAENVIKEVLSRVNSDMMNKVHKIHGTVSKQDIERAASRIHAESPRDPTKISTAPITSKPSMSSVLSREIEDIVLETLHNIVSNLRLEQSIKSQKGSKDYSSSNISQEIEDFVLSSLQNILLDHQDRRSQMDMGIKRSGSKTASSIELVSGESKEATAYVNEILQNVVQEMKAEMTQIGSKSSEDMSDEDSPNIQTMILEYLQSAMCDSQDQKILENAFELFSPDDVKKVLLETISATISNIKESRFSPSDLTVMYDAAMRFFNEADPQMELKEDGDITAELVVDLLEQVKMKVETIEIQTKTLNRISSQLVTLGMDVADSERSSPDNVESDLSVTSSLISDLVKDVLVRITKQLSEETRGNSDETEADVEGNTNNNDVMVTKSPSKTSSTNNDVNYNRRMSASTVGSCTSHVTSNTDKEFKLLSYSNTKTENAESKSSRTKKLPKRSTECRPVNKQSKMQSRMEPASKNSPEKSNQATRITPTKRLQVALSPKVSPPVEKTALNEKKKTSKESTLKRSVKASTSEKKQIAWKSLSPTVSSSTPTRKTTSTGKTLSKVSTINNGLKNNTKRDNVGVCKKSPRPPVDEPPAGLLELKSVCGVHKTKICIREQCSTINCDCGSSDKSCQH